MKILMFVFLLGIGLHGATAVTHSWKAFYTGSTGMKEFPEFVALNLLDDEVMGYFDSRTNRFESKQSWVMENLGQQYVEQQTNTLRGHVPSFKGSIATVMERFNQSKGVHIVQRMVGCEWDDETDEVKGFDQYGYDGEDFILLDLKTETFIAPKQQAFITRQKWDNNKVFNAQTKHYLTQICPDWLKKYVDYGRSSLMRTERPSVSLLQKTSSSPVSCHASGFYPDRASLFWRKDGEKLHEDVDHGEILPNHDGTFQMSVDLDLSSVTPEDWRRYECVFQLSGVKDDIVTKLDKAEIRTNEGNPVYIYIIAAVVVVLLALVLIAVVGFMVYRKKKAAKLPPPPDNSSEVSEKLNPDSSSSDSTHSLDSESSTDSTRGLIPQSPK